MAGVRYAVWQHRIDDVARRIEKPLYFRLHFDPNQWQPEYPRELTADKDYLGSTSFGRVVNCEMSMKLNTHTHTQSTLVTRARISRQDHRTWLHEKIRYSIRKSAKYFLNIQILLNP